MNALVDFLLARIAEDEADLSEPTEFNHRAWAECDAKRQIVETLEHDYRWASGPLLESASMVLEIMARPYVDHPDHREEWQS